MTTTDCRVYLPLTPAEVAELPSSRQLSAPRAAFTVTDRIRAADPSGDDEAWEFAALQEAARAAIAGGAVVVAAADVAATALDEGPEGQMQLTGAIALSAIAAFHVGDDVLTGTGLPNQEQELELSWYDTTELTTVVSLVVQPVEDS